jgi:hypothetical protein
MEIPLYEDFPLQSARRLRISLEISDNNQCYPRVSQQKYGIKSNISNWHIFLFRTPGDPPVGRNHVHEYSVLENLKDKDLLFVRFDSVFHSESQQIVAKCASRDGR